MFIEYALAFLAGSIPTAYWYAKYFHNIDIRKHGSGNVGATNSLRVMGKKAGIIVLIIDLLKGLIPVVISRKLGFSQEITLLMGIFAILGHLYSPFIGFKGGKGIATGLGVILGFSPIAALIAVITFVITLFSSKYVSLGSIFGVLAFLIYTLFTSPDSPTIQWLACGVAFLLIFSHRENIKRLIAGTENKMGAKKN